MEQEKRQALALDIAPDGCQESAEHPFGVWGGLDYADMQRSRLLAAPIPTIAGEIS